MKFAKVQFPSSEARVRALELLMPRAKVVALRDSIYIVPEPALALLTGDNIPHRVLESLHQDDVLQALRNTLAHPV